MYLNNFKFAHLRIFFSLNEIKQTQKASTPPATYDNCLATECSIKNDFKQYGSEDPAEGAAYCNHMLIN